MCYALGVLDTGKGLAANTLPCTLGLELVLAQ